MLSVTSGFWLAALPSALESQDEPLAVFHPVPARSHLALLSERDRSLLLTSKLYSTVQAVGSPGFTRHGDTSR